MGLVFSVLVIVSILLYVAITTVTAMFLYWLINRYLLKDRKMQWWQIGLLGVFCMLLSIPIVVVISNFLT
jgi:hypothetical protein